MKTLVAALNKDAERKGSSLFTVQDIRDVIARIRLTVSSLDDLIEVMNQQNYILRKGGSLYQLQTSTYSQVCVAVFPVFIVVFLSNITHYVPATCPLIVDSHGELGPRRVIYDESAWVM